MDNNECEFCNYLQYRGSHMNILSSFRFTNIQGSINIRYTYGADAGDYCGKGTLQMILSGLMLIGWHKFGRRNA